MTLPETAERFDLTTEHYGNIRSAYEVLWELFKNISGLEIKGSSSDLNISHDSGKVTVTSDGFLKIKGVGFEGGASGGPIDICFKPDLTVVGVEYNGERKPVIESSATAVSYLRILEGDESQESDDPLSNKTPADVLSAFHYDFDMDPPKRHPVFHAQYEPSSIKIGTLVSDYKIMNEFYVTTSYPNHPRIPTAPLDFAGVLHVLVCEHIDTFDSAWPNGTINAIKQLPKFPAWCFDPDPLVRGAMLPEWWYLHAREQSTLPSDVAKSRGLR